MATVRTCYSRTVNFRCFDNQLSKKFHDFKFRSCLGLRKYFNAEIFLIYGWYVTIILYNFVCSNTLRTDIEATTPEDGVTSEKQGSDASKKKAGDTSEEETNDRKPEQANEDVTTEDFREFLDTCERVMRDKDSVDFTAMHGILYGLPRSGKSSLLQRLIGNIPPAFSPSTLAAEKSVQVSIQDIRQRALERTVVMEGSDAADSTSKAIWRLVETLEEEAVLFLNDLPQVSTSTSSPEANPSTSTGSETIASAPLATIPQEPAQNAPQQPIPKAPQQPVTEAPQQPVPEAPQQSVPVPEAPQQSVPEAPQQPDQDVSPLAKPPLQPTKNSPSPDALKYFKECLRNRNWKELKQMFGRRWYLYLTDSGGQPEFQELIAFLASGPSIFFIVFRLDKDLDKLYKVKFIDAKGHSIKPYKSRHTAFETVLQSFSSIASLGGISHVQEDGTVVPTKPRVLLVGTHKDRVSAELIDEVDARFQKVIKELDTRGMVQMASASQMIFAVDNTQSPEAEDVQLIRNAFHRLGTDPLTRPEYQIKIPCPWLILGIMARKCDHPEPVLHFEDCIQLGQGCGIPEEKELKRALGYLGRMIGTLRHVQGKDKDHGRINFVLRTSQFLFTLVSNLIVQTFTFKNLPSDHRARDEFTKKGIFDASVFTAIANTSSKVLTPAMLLTLLKQLRIVAPIQEDNRDQQRYIMPCALAHVDAVKPSPQSQKPSPVKPLLFRFRCGYVPRGMFGALIAQLLQQAKGRLQWELDEDQIFRDQVTIELIQNRYTTVILRMLPSYFSITLQSPLSLASDQDKLSRLCCEVRDELLHSISEFFANLQMRFWFNVEYPPTV